MKVLKSDQIRALDAMTIEKDGITSLELMERAGVAFTKWFAQHFPPEIGNIHIFAGPGNNGGDALAVARLLSQDHYAVHLWICHIGDRRSPDFEANLEQLPKHGELEIYDIQNGDEFPDFDEAGVIVDGLFGSGLNRAMGRYWSELVEFLNEQIAIRVAIDIPSGMYADKSSKGTIFLADHTYYFQIPKLAFFMEENNSSVGELHQGHIGIKLGSIDSMATYQYLYLAIHAASMIRERTRIAHKGNFGHALLVMGSYGKIGAAILSAKACLRSGTGLVTAHLPKAGYPIMQMAFPEAMVSVDRHEFFISEFPKNIHQYKAIGIGCGLGTNEITQDALLQFIESYHQPLILDADALNIIAMNSSALSHLPEESILTPHPKEFERLFGKTADHFARLELLRKKAEEHQVYILLKGHYSSYATPDGNVFINTTGNSGMATAGSGDVLTGMITGFKAQGYSSLESGLLAMFLHGRAGDLAVMEQLSEEALIASDIVEKLGESFRSLEEHFGFAQ